jgi:hypothetical protein
MHFPSRAIIFIRKSQRGVSEVRSKFLRQVLLEARHLFM